MATTDSLSRARNRSWCSGTALPPSCQSAIRITPPPDRPNPAIYGQAPRLSAGLQATWDNPDITLFGTPSYGGGAWEFDLAGMVNPASISIHNLSTTAAAINTRVAVSLGYAGIGVSRIPVVTQLLSLAAGETRAISVPLFPPYINVDINGLRRSSRALFVEISHPYDADTANNYGEGALNLVLIDRRDAAGAVIVGFGPDIPITLENNTAAPLVHVLSVEPNVVAAQISPAQVTVAAGSIGTAQLSYTLPVTSPFETSVTVIARDLQGNLLGGLTQRLYSN